MPDRAPVLDHFRVQAALPSMVNFLKEDAKEGVGYWAPMRQIDVHMDINGQCTSADRG